jgi:hypothetical protein
MKWSVDSGHWTVESGQLEVGALWTEDIGHRTENR